MKRYVNYWVKRILISMRGFVIWLEVGWPFVLLFLGVLLLAIIRKAEWLHIWIILTLGSTLTIAEMLNFAIENLCDIVEPDHNDRIKMIKDICAGAVLVAGLALGIVGIWIILR